MLYNLLSVVEAQMFLFDVVLDKNPSVSVNNIMSVHFYTVHTTTYADDEFFTIPPQHCFSADDRGSEYLYLRLFNLKNVVFLIWREQKTQAGQTVPEKVVVSR